MEYKVYIPEVKINLKTSPRMEWCEKYIGEQYLDWDANPMDTPIKNKMSVFVFEREEDALMFYLKWEGVEV